MRLELVNLSANLFSEAMTQDLCNECGIGKPPLVGDESSGKVTAKEVVRIVGRRIERLCLDIVTDRSDT